MKLHFSQYLKKFLKFFSHFFATKTQIRVVCPVSCFEIALDCEVHKSRTHGLQMHMHSIG
jgi:hypothetical protein